MRTGSIVICMAGVLGCGVQPRPETPDPNASLARAGFLDDRHVFCFVDGHTTSCDGLGTRAPATIDRIEVIKGQTASDRYGPLAAGAVLVTSRPAAAADRPAVNPEELAFFFIDGRTASRSDLRDLPRDAIEYIEVLTGPTALAFFGSAAGAGVVLVRTNRLR